jgi:hypothetical protein
MKLSWRRPRLLLSAAVAAGALAGLAVAAAPAYAGPTHISAFGGPGEILITGGGFNGGATVRLEALTPDGSKATGQPLPDNSVRDAARNTILKTIRLRMDLLGLAEPRKSMSLQATMELDSENASLQAQLAEAYGAALAERDRQLADLRAQLARAQAPGPPALTALAEKAEQAGRS